MPTLRWPFRRPEDLKLVDPKSQEMDENIGEKEERRPLLPDSKMNHFLDALSVVLLVILL